jgi:hypothetical protein
MTMADAANGNAHYRTIKSLVLDYVRRTGGEVDYRTLTAEVRKHFPDSAWKKTHWAWYKNQILHGRFKSVFSDAERAALRNGQDVTGNTVARPVLSSPPLVGKSMRRGPVAKDPTVKRIGDEMLRQVRVMLDLAAGEDDLMRFKLNRWVFSRLLQDEIRSKRPIKKHLWESGSKKCQACGQPFNNLKGVELHRTDSSKGYSIENCELLCRECHQEIVGE